VADWFVAVADRAHDAKVGQALLLCGQNWYRPKYRETVIRRGLKTWRDRFFLGHYVLIELLADWANQFHQVLGTPGIRSVLAAENIKSLQSEPLLVREREVQDLRSRERRGYVQAPERFKRHDRIFVQRGPFVDQHGAYEFSDDRFDYVTIEGLLARIVKIPRGSIVAA
jgi:transcription antitermination factor NusG